MTAESAREKGLTAFRDYVIDGQPSSGPNNPDKPEIREFVDATSDALATLEEGQSGGFIIYDSWTALDLHPEGGLEDGAAAKVFNDAGTHTDPVVGGTVANNGVYSYHAGSPSGFKRVANLEADDAAAQVALATAQAAAAAAANLASGELTIQRSLFPDPIFSWSGGNLLATAGAYNLYPGTLLTNMTWDATYKHPYGVGGWKYNSALSSSMGFHCFWGMPSAAAFSIVPSDIVSIGALVVASGGAVSMSGYDCSAVSQTTGYTPTGATVTGSTNIAMDGTPKVLKIENHTVRAGSVAFVPHFADVAASDFRVIALWVRKGALAGDRPPVRETNGEFAKNIAAAVPEVIGKTDYLARMTQLWSSAALVGSDVTATGFVGMSNAFSGFAEIITPPAYDIQGFGLNALRQASGGGGGAFKPWAKLRYFARTGAVGAADDAGATVLAWGEIDLDPLKTSYTRAELWAPARAWVSGNREVDPLKTILAAEWGAEGGIIYQVLAADGSPASVDLTQGTRTDRPGTPRGYYTTTQSAATGAWSQYLPTPVPTGVLFCTFTGLADRYKLTPLAIADAASSQTPAELVALRGSEPLADTRVGHAMTPFGAVKGLMWRQDRMVIYRNLKRLFEAGTAISAVFAVFGDSWSQGRDYWLDYFTKKAVAKFGDGGPGSIGFGFTGGNIDGNARWLYAIAKSGAWTCNYGGDLISPMISTAVSSTAGDSYTITAGGAATVIPASAILFWEGTADGVIEVRWGGSGPWTPMNVQGTVGTAQRGALPGLPGVAVFTLEIRVVSGTVKLHLVDIRGAANTGAVVHKLACSGSRATAFAAVTAAQWRPAIAALAPNVAFGMWGTNESNQAIAKAVLGAALDTFTANLRTARPELDIVLASPCENRGTPTPPLVKLPMAEYEDAIQRSAETAKAAYLRLQSAFGETLSDYDGTVSRDWFAAAGDNYHMKGPANGVYAMPDAFLRLCDL